MENIIRDSLTDFIQSHIPEADLSAMDEVFFSYITSVLEELGSPDASEENFDMETFMEMMEGYTPGFSKIDSMEVYEMMFELTGKLRDAGSTENTPAKATERICNPSTNCSKKHGGKAEEKIQPPPEGASAQESDLKKAVEMLQEMFPACTVTQAEKVLSMTRGDMEEAVQLIVEGKVELCKNVNLRSMPVACVSSSKGELKDIILQKYMLIDDEEDKRTHRPVVPKEAPKKLIRYIDSQVVSMKGERYKDSKKPESEEMKKTYINLKPARKYKFH
ncbi:CUE domain-containing protein 2 [Microcaecilia unicolor]|uniref:CUE domain-containing protein 2 n=1 Tax=Microcaecilia unicolor TaxID=1415580 RepID=A0A6P7Y9C7_9AMPH|nr:CUE domain-containing protein 2 [Microcaecilia unicolor]XP_030059412.1 CUE domain-containing protein 2 [Microcaecilia unicolor]XP_030059413.1 CUE domain-containing protein 2 [Microcaecilia unicolor]XP_030059414.1 CUE domain-containing protein 2 [Microcaecilia unicolor]